MLKTLLFLSSFFLLISISSAQIAVSDSAKMDSATISAEYWLKLIDEEKYEDSWDQTSSFFKSKVTKDQWVGTISGLKSSLGKTISRKLLEARFTTSLPGVSKGEYVVILFQTSFEKKENAIETITPMKDTDNSWRVSGYFIK